MIIIDENSQLRLSQALEGFKAHPENHRCLHFHFATGPRPDSHMDTTSVHKHLLELIALNVPKDKTQVYLFPDYDAFVLSPNLTGKIVNKLITDVATRLALHTDKSFTDLYQLNLHIGTVQKIIEEKQINTENEIAELKRSSRRHWLGARKTKSSTR